MTNYEKIKNMSVEEMAKELNKVKCSHCIRKKSVECDFDDIPCVVGIRNWLNQEVEG